MMIPAAVQRGTWEPFVNNTARGRAFHQSGRYVCNVARPVIEQLGVKVGLQRHAEQQRNAGNLLERRRLRSHQRSAACQVSVSRLKTSTAAITSRGQHGRRASP